MRKIAGGTVQADSLLRLTASYEAYGFIASPVDPMTVMIKLVEAERIILNHKRSQWKHWPDPAVGRASGTLNTTPFSPGLMFESRVGGVEWERWHVNSMW